jgi:WD40 repeat protein
MSDGSSVSAAPSQGEALARQAESLWRRGQRPDPDRLLAAAGVTAPQTVAAVLAVDQWQRWHAGDRVSAENYLARYLAVAADPNCALLLVYGEFLVSEELGWAPSADDYLARFPQYAKALRAQFGFHAAVAEAEVTLAGPTLAGISSGRTVAPRDGVAISQRGGQLPVVPGYELLAEVGRGGMGVVYKAQHIALDRLVALKMVLGGEHAGPAEVERFRAEALAAARLQHPNIVQIHEVGEHGGLRFLAMEYVEGTDLARWLAGTPQAPHEAAALVEVLARAMQYAHSKGVVHRDLKPANVLLQAPAPRAGSVGTPKVTDFGLARRLDADSGQTRTGLVMGTPSYMAPEQAHGRSKEVGPASDVYALGALLYECLTGRPPFRGASVYETLDQVRSQDPVSPRTLQPSMPRDLETICLKCLRKEPGKRYASAADLADDLKRYQAGEPVRARPTGRVERAAKWARRRPATAALLAVCTLALLLGLAADLWFTDKLSDERTHAETERDNAKTERDNAIRLEGIANQARADADAAARAAKSDRDSAETARDAKDTALKETRRGLAIRNVMLAEDAWREGNVTLAQERLSDVPEELRGWEWRLLKRQYTGGYMTLYGHMYGRIGGLAFSPDGRRIASGGIDRTARIWDTATGRVLHTLTGHTDMVRAVAFSPDGRFIASCCWTIKLWDANTGRPLLDLAGHFAPMNSVAFAPDGETLATGGDDKTVKLWNVRTGQELRTLRGHTGTVKGVAFAADGQTVASASGDGVVKLWNPADGTERRSFSKGPSGLYGMALSPDGTRVAVGGNEGLLRVWDTRTGLELLKCAGHRTNILAVAYSPDGQQMASTGLAGDVRLWDAQTGDEQRALRGHTRGAWCVAYSADGQRLATAGDDGAIKVWDVRRNADALVLRGHRNLGAFHEVNSVAFASDGRTLASAASEGTVQLWDAFDGRELIALRSTRGSQGRCSFSPDGRQLASARGDGVLVVWDTSTGRELLTIQGHAGSAQAVAFDPNGRRFASAGSDRLVKVWGTDGRLLKSCAGHAGDIVSISWSPTGERLASTGRDRTVRIWDPVTGAVLRTLQGGTGDLGLASVAFSPDGQSLACSGAEGAISIWNALSGERRLVLKGHTGWVHDVAFGLGGALLASAGGDGQVKIWDALTGRLCLTLSGPGGSAHALAFSPDGQRLACGGAGGLVFVWDARPTRDPRQLKGHDALVGALEFDAAGRRLASTAEDGAVRVWNLTGGDGPVELKGTIPRAAGLRFSADGQRLAVRARDGRVSAWDAATGAAIAGGNDPCQNFSGPSALSPDGRVLAMAPDSDTISLIDMTEPDREDAAMRRGRAAFDLTWHAEMAETHARSGRWFAAMIHQRLLAAAYQSDGEQLSRLALLQRAAGQRDASRATCLEMLRRFDRRAAAPAAALLLGARPGDLFMAALFPQAIPEELRRWERQQGQAFGACMVLLNDGADRERLKSIRGPFIQITRAISECRTGNYDEAARLLAGWSEGLPALVLALAEHGRGKPAAAQQAFDNAVQWLKARRHGPNFPTNLELMEWWEQVEVHLLREEVEALVMPKKP